MVVGVTGTHVSEKTMPLQCCAVQMLRQPNRQTFLNDPKNYPRQDCVELAMKFECVANDCPNVANPERDEILF